MSEYIVSKLQKGNDTYKFKSAFQKEVAITAASSTSTYPNRYIKISGIPTNSNSSTKSISLLVGIRYNRYLINITPFYNSALNENILKVIGLSVIDSNTVGSVLSEVAYVMSSSSAVGTMDIYLKIYAKANVSRVTITNISENLDIPFEVTDIGNDNASYSGTTISAYFNTLNKGSITNLQTKELTNPITISGVSKSTVEEAISGLNTAIPVAKEFSIPANSTSYTYQNYYFKITDIPTKNTKADAQVMTFLIGIYGNVYLVYINPRYSENEGGRLVQCIDVTNYSIISPNIIECAFELSSTSAEGILDIWFKIKLYSSNQSKLTITNISANASIDWDIILLGNDDATYKSTTVSGYYNNLTKGSISHLQKTFNLDSPNVPHFTGTVSNMIEGSAGVFNSDFEKIFSIPIFIPIEKTVTSDFTLEATIYSSYFTPTTSLTILDCSLFGKPSWNTTVNIPMKIKTITCVCNTNGSFLLTIPCKANSDATSYNNGKCTRFYGIITAMKSPS